MLKTAPRRSRLALAAVALATPWVVLAAPAQAEPVVGAVSLNPATSTASNSNVLLETHGACPDGATNLKARLEGTNIDNTKANIVGNTGLGILGPSPYGGYSIPLANTFRDVLLNNSIVAPNGDYTVRVICQNASGSVTFGDFLGTVHIVHGSSDDVADGTYSYVAGASAVATTTSLSSVPPTPASPVAAGTSTTVTATVTPSSAVGAVQFKRGGTNVGSPVSVSAGLATYTGALSAGDGSLTAVFVPTDAEAYKTSTSGAVPYVVVGPASITGTVAVGKVVTCSVSSGGTQTFSWMLGGAAQAGYTSKTATIPASWLGKALTCKATVTVDANSVSQTSPAKTVALGAALKATAAPKLSGIPKVGKKLTCKHGTWSPAATTYTYQWLRNGKAIAKATKSTYTLTAKDKGKKVSCKVTAKKPGYANGVAKTAAKTVS